MKFYQQVSVAEELPEEPKDYHHSIMYDTELGPLKFIGHGPDGCDHGWYDNKYDKCPKPRYWYKEFSLSEVIIEFTKYLTTYSLIGKNIYGKQEWSKDDTNSPLAQYYTTDELVNIFLTEKGYITK